MFLVSFQGTEKRIVIVIAVAFVYSMENNHYISRVVLLGILHQNFPQFIEILEKLIFVLLQLWSNMGDELVVF